MKTLDTFLGSLLLCVTSLPLILLLLTLQQDPAVPANPALGPAQVNEIQQLLIDHDPRQLLSSPYQEVRLSENELNALLTYLRNSNPSLANVNMQVDLIDDGTDISLSLPASISGLQRYFNITLHFTRDNDQLLLSSLDAGALSIPPILFAPIREALALRMSGDENFELVSTFFDSLHFQSISEEQVVILLDWHKDQLDQFEDQARQIFVSAREAERLRFYHEKLAEVTAALPQDASTVRLNDLLRPLFLYASINSAGGADAVAENRAVFIVLSTYLTDLELNQLTGTDIKLAPLRQVKVVIESREDLARHVVSSAAIATSAGATMAEVLSVYKEVHDSRYRTGFSFTDIAANQVGSLLGTLASRSQTDAILFQDMMKDISTESAYMPPLGTYDGMTEDQFIQRYGSRESESYQQRLEEISSSINARPFYQAFAVTR